MKNRLIPFVAVLLSFVFITEVLPVSANTSGYTEVMILVEDNTPASSAKAAINRELSHFICKTEYSVLIKGFHAEVKENEVSILRGLPGVKAVYETTEYSALSNEEEEARTVYAPGTEPVYMPDFGEGSVIAVIDNGFNLRHSQFKLPDTDGIAITERNIGDILNFTKALKKYPYLKLKSAYKSTKVPFAFDYANNDTNVNTTENHGTAMMSAAAGNGEKSGIYIGAAPSAQVLAMKVYDDTGKIAKTVDIVAALEDAYILGANVVSMSLGAPCGFSEAGLFDPVLEEAIASLEEKGVIVVSSAGNDSTLGKSTIFSEYYGYDAPLASMPDYGTVNTPSTGDGVLSVASATAYVGKYYAFILEGTDTLVPYSDSNRAFGEGDLKKLFSETFAGKTLEYIPVGGVGKLTDFEAVKADIAGKVALVERGEISFSEKVSNAYAYGAVAVIVYDNEDDYAESLKIQMQLDNVKIPAVLISATDGKRLVSAENKRIVIEKRLTYVTDAGELPYPSEFSSPGPTPTLKLKPEITATGANMTLAAANGGYVTLSGTSNSSAYTAGIVAGIYKNFVHLEGKERTDAIKAFLLNCAVPMKDKSGAYYAANYQGAGLIDLKKLNDNQITLLSENKPVSELGNKVGKSFSIPITVINNTNKQKVYSASAIVGTNSYEAIPFSDLSSEKDAFYKENGILLHEYFNKSPEDIIYFTGNTILEFETARISVGGVEIDERTTVSLAPGEKKELTLTVEIDPDEIDALSEVYPNGMYVQGYVMLDGDTHCSLPFLGFIGDFYKDSPIDAPRSHGSHIIDGTYLYSFFEDNVYSGKIALGTNNIMNGNVYKNKLYESLAVISPDAKGANSIVYLNMALNKNLSALELKVFSESGEEVCSAKKLTGVEKSYFDKNAGYTNIFQIPLWDMRSEENDNYIFDDGSYTCVINATNAAGNTFTEKLGFIIDSQKPKLVDYKTTTADGKTYLDVTVKDENYLQAVYAYGFSGSEIIPTSESIPSDEALLNSGKGAEYTVRYEITPNAGGYIYIKIYDLAFNTSLVRIVL